MVKFILDNFDTIFRDEKSFETFDKMILDLAVRGKLVPQIEDEEPASKLLQRIKEEKERLVAEKVIKKEKLLSPITEDEKPFEIPSSWEWIRLGDISKYIQRGKSPKYSEVEKIPVISQKCVQWTGFDISKARFIDPKSLEKYAEDRILQKNDLLWNSTGEGTLGRIINFVPTEKYETIVADSHVTIIRPLFINSKFCLNWFSGPKVQGEINNKSTGSTKQTELSTKTIKEYIFPLPPLKEQERIVEKVEKLQELSKKFKEIYNSNEKTRANLKKSILEEVEKSDTNNELLISLEKLFGNFEKVIKTKEDLKDIRNLVLSLAVRGKLVPQIEDEEPASRLLEKIKEEKERLIAEKIIKKEKPLPPITEDEKPFDIPESWEWVRLNEIANISAGRTPKINELSSQGAYPYFKISDMNTAGNELFLKFSKNYLIKSYKGRIFNKNTIVFPKNGGAIFTNKRRILIKDSLVDLNTGTITLLSIDILNYFFKWFSKIDLKSISKGTALPTVDSNILKNFLFPLPPLKEQERIVKRVDELMAVCDTLESKIETSEKINQKLLASLLK